MSRPSKTWTDKLKSLIENRIKELSVEEKFDELDTLSVVVDVGKFIDSRVTSVVTLEPPKPETELTTAEKIINNEPASRSRIVMKPEKGQL